MSWRLVFLSLMVGAVLLGQRPKIVWSEQEKPIMDQLRGLRKVPDSERGNVTKRLATEIRELPAGANKVNLATGLAGLSTEGDFGQDSLQQVAATLAEALRETPEPTSQGKIAEPYILLGQLVRYEHVHVSLEAPQFEAAIVQMEEADQVRQHADLTLSDLQGKIWNLKELRGKVVLVNFWATWCPPCRKEMPDLETVYQRFKDQGLVILAISDEDAAKVQSFVAERKFSYPILLDPGRKVNVTFRVEGIPRSFIYDRDGKMVAEAIDMRTQRQFLELLGRAGLK